MSKGFKAIITITGSVLVAAYEFYIFVVPNVTPNQLSSNTSIWMHDHRARLCALVLFIVWVLICLFIWCGETILSKSRRRDPSAIRSSASPLPPSGGAILSASGTLMGGRTVLDISPDDLMQYFKDHIELQAQRLLEPFIGQLIKIQDAEVWNAERAGKEFRVYVTITNGNACLYFTPAWEKRVSVLRKGSKITIIGKIKAASSHFVIVENCEIIS